MKLSLQRVVTIDEDYNTTLMADFNLLIDGSVILSLKTKNNGGDN